MIGWKEFMINHIGYIVDGNRRWAREKKLPTLEGHRRGMENVKKAIIFSSNKKIPYTSFFLFSTENWSRTGEEVNYLMDLFRKNFNAFKKIAKEYNLKYLFLGTEKNAPSDIISDLHELEKCTSKNTGVKICICFNYGGRQEILEAAEKYTKFVNDQSTQDLEVTEENFANFLYQPEVPNLDLVVRTSGEQRISGFMLWRAAYAEFLFEKKYFPDLTDDDFENFIEEFNQRQRRFGK